MSEKTSVDPELEETLLAACAERAGASGVPEALTERLFFVREQMERAGAPPVDGACLLASGPRLAPAWIPLGDACTVGRDADCRLVLDDSRISRQHLRIDRRDDHWQLSDLDSQNGVRINGKSVDNALLRSGDVIEIADFALIFVA